MLRNLSVQSALHVNLTILNEVLSLNAQECLNNGFDSSVETVLNEVLSLNAQESECWKVESVPASPQ